MVRTKNLWVTVLDGPPSPRRYPCHCDVYYQYRLSPEIVQRVCLNCRRSSFHHDPGGAHGKLMANRFGVRSVLGEAVAAALIEVEFDDLTGTSAGMPDIEQ